MSRKIRKNILVGYGNQGLYPAGLPVYDTSNNSRQGSTVLVKPGQFVIWDPTTNLSINTATWTKSTHGRFHLGVGYDGEGKGYSTAIRQAFGDLVYGHNLRAVKVALPTCGLVDIKDVFLKGCITTDQPITFNVSVTDGRTMGEFAFNKSPMYTTTINVPSDVCGSCDDEISCAQVIDQVMRMNRAQTAAERVKNVKRGGFIMPERDYHIVPLYSTSYAFNLSPMSGQCDFCTHVQGITSLVVAGETVTFTNSTSGDYTSFGQLENIVHQINRALNGKGAAVLTHGTGSCCPYQIQINTCLVIGNLGVIDGEGEADTMAPTTSNPFAEIVNEKASVFCDAEGTSFTPTCGFRIIAKSIDFDESCYTQVNPIPFPVRTIQVFGPPTESGKFPFYVKDTQKATYPFNLGAYWALEDYKSDNGGTGRDHNAYNMQYGELGLPGKKDRINGVAVDPRVPLVSVTIEQSTPSVPFENIGYMNVLNGTTVLLIPEGDTATRTAIQTALNNYITTGENARLPAITV